MKKYIENTVVNLELSEVTCDICGKKFDAENNDDIMEIQEMISIDTVCGYGSVFGDTNRIQIDICQHCFKNKFGDKIRINDDIEENHHE